MRINKKGSLIALLLAVCVLAFASLAAAADKAPVLRMATTTSTPTSSVSGAATRSVWRTSRCRR